MRKADKKIFLKIGMKINIVVLVFCLYPYYIYISVTLYWYIYIRILIYIYCLKSINWLLLKGQILFLDPCRGINTMFFVVYFGVLYIRLCKVNCEHLWAMKGKIRSWRSCRMTRRQVRKLEKKKQSSDFMYGCI